MIARFFGSNIIVPSQDIDSRKAFPDTLFRVNVKAAVELREFILFALYLVLPCLIPFSCFKRLKSVSLLEDETQQNQFIHDVCFEASH